MPWVPWDITQMINNLFGQFFLDAAVLSHDSVHATSLSAIQRFKQCLYIDKSLGARDDQESRKSIW